MFVCLVDATSLKMVDISVGIRLIKSYELLRDLSYDGSLFTFLKIKGDKKWVHVKNILKRILKIMNWVE